MRPVADCQRRWTTRVVQAHHRPLRVLVVDDNINAADALAMYLTLMGMSVESAYGGAHAIAFAIDWLPDVILLDISMPEVDGFTVAKRLRADPQAKDAVIVALTAHDERYVSQHASQYEFDAYCQKGHTLAVLDALFDEFRGGSQISLSGGALPY